MKVAIDGPAASGKSTIAKRISLELKIPYLETGLAYRAVGYMLLLRHPEGLESVSWEDIEPLLSSLEIIPKVGETVVKVNGREVNKELGSEEVGKMASLVGTVGRFREYINRRFRELIGNGQVVVEGRDAGTNIIPDAQVKIFITASPEERAKRRYNQLLKAGKEASYEKILRDIVERDRRDTQRKEYPFKPAPDAVVIDTTGKTVEEAVSLVLGIIRERKR